MYLSNFICFCQTPTKIFPFQVTSCYMSLQQEEIQRLSTLARLDLTPEEAKRAEHELEAILGYVDRLQQIDTKNVEPQTMPARTDWRLDRASACDDMTRELVLANFPSRKGDLLHVPPVFEKPKG